MNTHASVSQTAGSAATFAPPARNPLQGVTTALPKAMPGSQFPELNQPVTHKKRQLLYRGAGGTLMVNSAPTHPSELSSKAFKRLTAARIAAMKPEWTSLDKKTLRFYGYFKEGVHDSQHERERIRRVAVLFFLEDDTCQVSEPRQENSGITQGCLIKRHRIPKKGPSGEYFLVDDFKVGETIALYGKTIMLVDCDPFTRQFFEDVGMPQPDPLPYPDDPYLSTRTKGTLNRDPELRRVMELDASQRTGGTVQKLTKADLEATRTFFVNDRKVLRFFCKWDDRTVYGGARVFTLLHYLADGTCVVSEINPPNSGRDPFPTFVRRQKIPKKGTPIQERSLETISVPRNKDTEFYNERDFALGAKVNVFGREMVIFDMDEATRRYYREKYGVEDFTPIPISDPPAPPRQNEPPPFNGFGSEDDSLGSWLHLVLKPPKKDYKKELEFSDKVLRFGAVLASDQPCDYGRHFIICFYLSDDTVQVYEQAQRNSGIVGGKFLQRQKVKTNKPGEPTQYLSASELYVGAEVSILSNKFRLVSTDERTVAIMEGRPKQFTVADANEILKKLRNSVLMRHTQITDAFRHFDKDRSGAISLEEFRQVLREHQIDVSEHELVTLMRYFDKDGDGVISYHEFVDRMIPKDYAGDLDAEKGTVDLDTVEDNTKKYVNADKQVDRRKFADKVFRMFKDKMATRRIVLQDAFRQLADAAPDASLGEKEFRKCVRDTLQLHLSDEEEDALTWKFFYIPERNAKLRRIDLKHFTRVFDSTSNFSTRYM